MLIESARMLALKKNDMTACASIVFRMLRECGAISAVCDAAAMVNEKYMKSQ